MQYTKKMFVGALLLLILPAGALAKDIKDLVVPRTLLRTAIQAQERHTDAMMLDPNVVGTAVGVGAEGHGVVKIFVQDARIGRLPGSLDGIPVEVEETGEIVALREKPEVIEPRSHTTARFPRPVPIGVSTGHPDITAGTIGCRVKDGVNVYALSNNHVYADSNSAIIGDNVLQPGPVDGGIDSADAIGTLFDFKPIIFSTSASNTIDAAIARSSTLLLRKATPSDGYGVPKSSTVPPSVGLRVMKYGRTTVKTNGIIVAINATVNVDYGAPGTARFVRQIIIAPGSFSAGGDSGSLIVIEGGSNARKPVGLLFAGSSLVTVANPISAVLSEFGVTVDGN